MFFMGIEYPDRPGIREAFGDRSIGDELREISEEIKDENPELSLLAKLAALDADLEDQSFGSLSCTSESETK